MGVLRLELSIVHAVVGCARTRHRLLISWGRLRYRMAPLFGRRRMVTRRLNSPRALGRCVLPSVPLGIHLIPTPPLGRVNVARLVKLQQDRVVIWRLCPLDVHALIRKWRERRSMLSFGGVAKLTHGIPHVLPRRARVTCRMPCVSVRRDGPPSDLLLLIGNPALLWIAPLFLRAPVALEAPGATMVQFRGFRMVGADGRLRLPFAPTDFHAWELGRRRIQLSGKYV